MGRAAVKFHKSLLQLLMLPAALVALGALAPASAQYWGPVAPAQGYDGRIPPQQIEAMVRGMGFHPVADPRMRGPLWVTHAVDRDGQQVRVLIDSYSGRMIDVLRRPLPPQRVALAPSTDFPPPFNGPISDYDGPDYDYRHLPQQRPADWPPSYPGAQQQGPRVETFNQQGENIRVHAPAKARTAKKKETKKKDEKVAALKPAQAKDVPAPEARPKEAPKAEAPKQEAPKTAEVPTFVPNPDQKPASSGMPPVQPLELKKSEPSGALPPVQAPF